MKKFIRTLLVAVLFTAVALAQKTTYNSTALGFSIVSPTTLTLEDSKGTTDAGVAYVAHMYQGSTDNGIYMIMIGEYPFPLQVSDLDKMADGFAKGAGGTIQDRQHLTLSNQPAERIVVTRPDGIKFINVITFKGYRAYQVAFGMGSNSTSNADEVRGWFNSFQIQ